MDSPINTQSSLVKSVGYDGKNLYVTLTPNRNYKFLDVPYNDYYNLITAESKGKYFNSNIVGKFKSLRIN
jgi:hypothetical protein